MTIDPAAADKSAAKNDRRESYSRIQVSRLETFTGVRVKPTSVHSLIVHKINHNLDCWDYVQNKRVFRSSESHQTRSKLYSTQYRSCTDILKCDACWQKKAGIEVILLPKIRLLSMIRPNVTKRSHAETVWLQDSIATDHDNYVQSAGVRRRGK